MADDLKAMNAGAGPEASGTHLVLIPSFNPGELVFATVATARNYWNPVWVVVDGSTDGTGERLQAMAAQDSGLRIIVLPRNRGKGAAILAGCQAAADAGFTHVLTMDSDGQHPAASIRDFMAASAAAPAALVLGVPQFDASAPALRVKGRRVSNWWANFMTVWLGIEDSLFGFRVYPLQPLLNLLRRHRWMRRFDFDAEAAVRLTWQGLDIVNRPAPVRYVRPEDGGVSHFNYWRDNALLSWMYLRLLAGFVPRLPGLLVRRRAGRRRLLERQLPRP